MSYGLSDLEMAQLWNKSLTSLGCTLAKPELPDGMTEEYYLSLPGHIRVPESDPTKYSTYRVYMDLAAAVVNIIATNNERITEQLKAAGIELD